MPDLEEQVALVTGAGRGIGREVALALAADGAYVALMGRSRAGLDAVLDEVARAGGRGATVPADVTRAGQVRAAVDDITRHLGPIDLLVSNAGLRESTETTPWQADPTDWWRVLETNLRGPALLCRRLVPGMAARGRGHVIDVNSRASVWDDPGQSSVASSVSKAGLARFTAALAGELRGSGVVVVDLSPGMVRTGMTATRPDIDDIPDHWFLPASAAADKVVGLVTGTYDDLHGHFVHALDDLDELLAHVRADPQVRTLSLVPHGDDDPIG